MRVVAGSAGGQRLQSPASILTRPTTDRVREAIFNSLTSLDAIEGASIADLFAGTGACGIEALSRGARSVVFVEKDAKAASVIKSNVANVGFESASDIVTADAFKFLERGDHFDVVIADPPYKFGRWTELMCAVDAGVLVCEANSELKSTDRWHAVRDRKHGDTHFTIFKRQAG